MMHWFQYQCLLIRMNASMASLVIILHWVCPALAAGYNAFINERGHATSKCRSFSKRFSYTSCVKRSRIQNSVFR
jgi:hypothetical protein